MGIENKHLHPKEELLFDVLLLVDVEDIHFCREKDLLSLVVLLLYDLVIQFLYMLGIQRKLLLLLLEFFNPEVIILTEFIFSFLDQEQRKDLLLDESYFICEYEWRDLDLVELFYVENVVLGVEEEY